MNRILPLVVVALCFFGVEACRQSGNPSVQPPDDDRYPLEKSQWIAKEKQTASRTLSAHPSDVLVVPFQTDGDSFDMVERSLMTRAVAERLRLRSQRSVADPTLVERALGTSARRISDASALDLATQVHASTVVFGHVGHDNAGKFHLRIESARVSEQSLAKRRVLLDLRDVAFSDTNPPYVTLRAHLDAVADDIGGARAAPNLTAKPTQFAMPVPASIAELESLAQQGPVPAAYLLQFLGVLHPAVSQDRARDGLFERSLLLLEGLSDTAEIRTLKARAWGYLNRRPVALAVLDTATGEEMAVRAYLDGDLEGLSAAVPKISSALPKVLATIERERLRLEYDEAADPAVSKELASQYPYWAPVLLQALAAADPWAPHSGAPLALALDAYWPNAKYDLMTAIGAGSALGKPLTNREIAELAYRHIDEALIATDDVAPGDEGPHPADVLDLLREMLAAAVVTDIRHVLSALDQPEGALEEAESYAPLFAGLPDFEIARGLSERSVAALRSEPQKNYLETSGSEHLRQGVIWSQGQTSASQPLWRFRLGLFPESATLGASEAARLFFDSDWPSLPGWGTQAGGTDEERDRRLQHCVDYTLNDLSCFTSLYRSHVSRNRNEAAAALLAANQHRFAGAPGRVEFLAEVQRQAGNLAGATATLAKAIDAGTTDWEPYLRSGLALAVKGKSQDALAVFLRYPGFKDPSAVDAVAMSNRAYEVGSILYWAGSYEQARPLYEFAAQLGTGSEASITSDARLALLARDFGTAREATAERARRYGSAYALRDLMMLSAAFGDRKSAWALFNAVQDQLIKPDLWVGALAVQRMEDASAAAIVDWAMQRSHPALRTRLDSLSARHIFLSQVTDRDVTDALATTLHERDTSPRPIRDEHGRVTLAGRMLAPSWFYQDAITEAPRVIPQPEQVDTRLTFAALGFSALARKDFERACQIFVEMSRLYELQEFLPYYAVAVTRGGDRARLERYLTNAERQKRVTLALEPPDTGQFFDEYLSHAVLEASVQHVDAALDYLVRANADVQQTEERAMFVRYEIAEIAELIYEQSSERRYRDFMVDLARRNAIVDPLSSWPHAFIAKYADNADERRIALARALYLDPHSKRALTAGAREIADARRLIASRNPVVDSGHLL